MHGWDRAALQKMTAFEINVHEEIRQEQVTHIDPAEYTDERIATLLAKMAEAKRWWPGRAKVNL